MSKPSLARRIASLLVLAALFLVIPGLSAEDSPRKVKNRVTPTYPELARRFNAAGTVKIQVVVAPNGSVKTTKVVGGHPLLAGAAEEAVKKWKYEPAPEETTTVVEFNFAPGM